MAERSGESRGRWRRFVVESSVIALGVFLGLAADAAWGARQDAAREVEYLRQLDADLLATEAGLDRAILSQGEAEEAGRKALMGVNAASLPPSDSLAQWVARSFVAPRFEPTMGTVVGLIETGDIGLVSHRELRNQLLAYQQESESYLNTGARYLESRMRATEAIGRMANKAAFPRRRVILDEIRLPLDFESLVQEPEFLSAVEQLWSAAEIRHRFLRLLRDQALRVREALDTAMRARGLAPAAT